MKLFQQLLVAPAALGLMAPIAVNATEINLNGISNYAPVINEFQTASELSDIHPSDWTFQALTEIRNSRRCNVSLPQGVITRAEAAALLNKCLSEATNLNESELRLVDEFGAELATIRGTQDVLDGFGVDAAAFSPTTKFSGSINMTTGGVSELEAGEQLHTTHSSTYVLASSFTGEDLLTAEFEMGNGSDMGLDLQNTSGNTGLYPELTDLYYSFPWNNFTVCAGALLDGDACLAGTSSVYSENAYNTDAPFTLGSVSTGPGIAVNWVSPDSGFNASANLQSSGTGPSAGLLTDESTTEYLTGQIGYDGEGWGGTFNWTDIDGGDSAWGLGAYWTPEGWPSLSAGFESKDQMAANNVDLTAYFIGVEGPLGPGTYGISYVTKESGTTTATDKASYELWYAYPINDNLTITPMAWMQEKGRSYGSTAHEYTKDQVGVAVNVGFSF